MIAFVSVSGCTGTGETATAEAGDLVQVHYTGTLADGTVFDTSEGREPLQFTVGAGEMIAGFDQAVPGMAVGESKTVTIPADQAYGAYRDDLLIDFDREQVNGTVEVGQKVTITTSSGQAMNVPVVNVTDSTITVDANHPLAGKDLTFTIELVEIA
ncbi:peptidylprolyl isomerase [Methanoculleus sp. FWC-SCC1]|uniref:Peptidyl-prolyl cis-trans isomerase n=2 Tax=Methanoculleus frigidifontis TaxID=2584085 RepID=A0ABT8M684_9EURY|nr:peptidylprolyl isomerase [Methanoculleus sp. FWC-SCC1]